METPISHRYIVSNPEILHGEPIITGTRTPVRAIAEFYRMAVPIEEIPYQLSHLTRAEVFDALRYYAERTQEINGYIERNHVPASLMHPLLRNK